MTLGPLLALLAAAPLPDAPWAVTGDGSACALVSAEILAELRTWHEDADNTVAEEGIFGRVHPARPSALVLLFASREACERIRWAAREERAVAWPVSPKTVAEVHAWLDELLRTDPPAAAAWRELGTDLQRALRDETVALFAGDASRRQADRALAAAERAAKPGKGERAGREVQRRARVARLLWPALYAAVFGVPYVAPPMSSTAESP